MKTTNSNLLLLCFLFSVVIYTACQKDIKPGDTQQQSAPNTDDANALSSTAGEMVLTWNNAATVAVARIGGLPPMPASRIYAMVNVSIHDALNTIRPMYERYALADGMEKKASPDAAVAQAAHDVIIAMLPPQQAYADSLLNISLNSITDGNAKTKGINLGKASAAAMLAKRQNDGASTAQYTVAQGTLPGQYRSTPPNDVTGFMAVPGWGKITPFGLASGSQFRPQSPYPIQSVAYAQDLNEIKRIGGAVSSVRTADQTQIALFWLPIAPYMFNNIARTLIAQKNIIDAWKIARLLALVQMAEADANIACFEAKYYYFYWRPSTGIHLADSDGNRFTKSDTTWQPLEPPTPPVPDYPSNHACNGAAAATVIAMYFGTNDLSFDVTGPRLPGVVRSFTSLSQAARENALSRIYVGYHFRNAVDEGEAQGENVGHYIFQNALRPK